MITNFKIFEDVADKYAEDRFGFKDNDSKDFEFKYQNYISNIEPVAYVNDKKIKNKRIAIFKNPKTLNMADAEVRAIGTASGDLYVAQQDYDFCHDDMGKALGFPKKLYGLNRQFVFLYRYKNTKSFLLGESTSETFNDLSDRNTKITENILKNIKRKNPQFNFYNIALLKDYKPRDISKFEPVPLCKDETIIEEPKQSFISTFKKFFRNESFNESPDTEELRVKFQDELSKHLKKVLISSDDFRAAFPIVWHQYFETPDTIFLLTDNYGARIENIIDLHQLKVHIVKICSIKFNSKINKFIDGDLIDNYESDKNISIEDFVKNFVDKLKKSNEKRLKNIETVKLKNGVKKYNL